MNEGADRGTRSTRQRLAFWLGTVPGHALAGASCLLLFVMMLLTFIDVVGRNWFAAPLPALYEIISFMMPGIIFCVLPMVCYREGHVTIDLLDGFVPEGWKRWQSAVVNLVSSATVAFISWRLAVKSLAHFEFNEATDELYLSMWPFSAFTSVLSAVAAVALLAVAIGYIMGLRHRPTLHEAGRA